MRPTPPLVQTTFLFGIIILRLSPTGELERGSVVDLDPIMTFMIRLSPMFWLWKLFRLVLPTVVSHVTRGKPEGSWTFLGQNWH